jgi:hypothetical protein
VNLSLMRRWRWACMVGLVVLIVGAWPLWGVDAAVLAFCCTVAGCLLGVGWAHEEMARRRERERLEVERLSILADGFRRG